MSEITPKFREYILNRLFSFNRLAGQQFAERMHYPCTDLIISPELWNGLQHWIDDPDMALQFKHLLEFYPDMERPRPSPEMRAFFRKIIEPQHYLEFLRRLDVECVPPIPNGLSMSWDDLANVPVADYASLSDWNTFLGTAFPEIYVDVDDNFVILSGQSGITIPANTFLNNLNLIQIGDTSGDCVIEVGANAFEGATNLFGAGFPACITVGDAAFNNCVSLAAVDFTSAETLGSTAFASCPLNLSAIFSSLITIGDGAFAGTTINEFVGFDSTTVQTIGANAFDANSALQTATFPNCTSVGMAAFNGSAITTANFPLLVDIPDFMFNNCFGLLTVTAPIAETAGASSFLQCFSLLAIDLPELLTADDFAFATLPTCASVNCPNLTTIGDSNFSGMDVLTTLSLPALTTLGADCIANNLILADLSIPLATTYGAGCFNLNPALTTVDFASFTSLTTAAILVGSPGASMTFANMPDVTDESGDELFQTTVGLVITVNVNVILETIDGGNPAPWLVQLLIDNPGSTINYI